MDLTTVAYNLESRNPCVAIGRVGGYPTGAPWHLKVPGTAHLLMPGVTDVVNLKHPCLMELPLRVTLKEWRAVAVAVRARYR